VVERRNRTVMDMSKALLKSMMVPGEFWGEAIRHFVYLLNRLPTKMMGDTTPYEAWNGRKPSLGHLKMFGCIAHARLFAPHLKKINDRSKALVYFGTEEGSKAHRLFDRETKRIVVSRDVVFEEKKTWSWDSIYEGDIIVDFDVENEAGTGYVGDGDNGDFQQEQGVPIEAGSADELNNSDGVPDMLQSTTTNTIWSSSDAKSSAAGFSTPQHTVPVFGNSTLSSVESSEPMRFRDQDEIYDDTSEVELVDSDVEALLAETEEPTCYKEAADHQEWIKAIDKEMQSIIKNETWELVKLPTGKRPIGMKWVYKLKRNLEGKVVKHKERLVAKGYV
jgi:hypothetical protein